MLFKSIRFCFCGVIIYFFLCNNVVYAQKKTRRYAPDPKYIESYPEYLALGMYVIAPTTSLRLETKKDTTARSGNKVLSNYQANLSNIIGFSFGYRAIHVVWGFNVASDKQKNKDLVASKYNSFAVRVKHHVYYLLFRYSKLQGLTDMNTQNSSNPLSPYVKRPDIKLKEYAFEGIYNFSWRKYSYTAPLTFMQRQLKSRVGILLKTGVSYSELTADSGLVSDRESKVFDKLNDIQKIDGVSIKLAPGFGGNLILFKRVYLSAALFLAYDLYFYDYKKFSDGSRTSGTSFVVVVDGRASLGYQSERLYAGLRYEVDRRGLKFDKAQMTTEYSYVGLEFGYRFHAPKQLKRVYDAIIPSGRSRR